MKETVATTDFVFSMETAPSPEWRASLKKSVHIFVLKSAWYFSFFSQSKFEKNEDSEP